MARRKRKSDEAPGWVWMLFGLGIGLIIALGVYMNGRPPENPAVAALPQPDAQPEPVVIESPPEPEPEPVLASETESEPEAETDEPAEEMPNGEDPNRFNFYEFLPSFEVVIPEVETAEPSSSEAIAIENPGVYELQAGAFLTSADAEAQRARLALIGIESRIQSVTIDDRTFHRVRIGPIEDLDELNALRTRLARADFESLIMRLAD